MAAYYLDTSALTKRYVVERGSARMLQLTGQSAGHELFTARAAGPEVVSALFRRARAGEVTLPEARDLRDSFMRDWHDALILVEVLAGVTERAMVLVESHGLRGVDAIHVAAALEVQGQRRATQRSGLTFLSADDRQLQAARAEGLAVENPERHRR